jgi:hypothetical protein
VEGEPVGDVRLAVTVVVDRDPIEDVAPNRRFGPPAGPSRGMKLAMRVTVFGRSGLTKA